MSEVSESLFTDKFCQWPILQQVQPAANSSSSSSWSVASDCSIRAGSLIPETYFQFQVVLSCVSGILLVLITVQSLRKYRNHRKVPKGRWYDNQGLVNHTRTAMYALGILLLSIDPGRAMFLYGRLGIRFIHFSNLVNLNLVSWSVVLSWLRTLAQLTSRPWNWIEKLKRIQFFKTILVMLFACFPVPINNAHQAAQEILAISETFTVIMLNTVYGFIVYSTYMRNFAMVSKNSFTDEQRRILMRLFIIIFIISAVGYVFVGNSIVLVLEGLQSASQAEITDSDVMTINEVKAKLQSQAVSTITGMVCVGFYLLAFRKVEN